MLQEAALAAREQKVAETRTIFENILHFFISKGSEQVISQKKQKKCDVKAVSQQERQ